MRADSCVVGRVNRMVDADLSDANPVRREAEYGLSCARQGRHMEAVTHFVLARERMTPPLAPLAIALDTIIETQTRYWQAQQALHMACRCFATADGEQQTSLAALEAVLSTTESNPEASLMDRPMVKQSTPFPVGIAMRQSHAAPDSSLPSLTINCFGHFAVWRAGEQIQLCSNRNGQAILRYIVAHPRHSATTDVLMDALWPEDAAIVARHKLHVAVSALRSALNRGYSDRKGTGYLLYESGTYLLNPMIPVQIDVEEFLAHYRSGQRADSDTAITHYEAACALYTGQFLPEDMYADWSLIQREQLTQIHLTMCSALATYHLAHGRYDLAAQWSTVILEEDRCDETAYRQLMYAYASAGRRIDALRQYQRCERVLADELGAQPMPETSALFYTIVRGEPLPDLHSA